MLCLLQSFVVSHVCLSKGNTSLAGPGGAVVFLGDGRGRAFREGRFWSSLDFFLY